MNKANLKAYTACVVEAALSRSTALEIELAVGFAVILECDGAKRLARETLLTIYAGAGSKCSKPGDIDWKAINRRISASVALFDFIGMEDLEKWAEGKTKRDLVEAFRPHIGALKLKSVNEVLLACDKIRPPRASAPSVSGTKLSTKHLHITIPKNATADELLAMAAQLMAMAHTLQPGTTEVQVEEPAEA